MKSVFVFAIFFVAIFSSCTEKEVEVNHNVSVYPNPFIESVTVEINSSENYEIAFLTPEQDKVEIVKGNGNASLFFQLKDYKKEVIICQIKIGAKLYVYQLINAGS